VTLVDFRQLSLCRGLRGYSGKNQAPKFVRYLAELEEAERKVRGAGRRPDYML
jgi:hypothetical protein